MKKINPIHSWIYKKGENDSGEQMSTLGSNGNELFCYVEDKQENAHIEIYNGTGKLAKTISIQFSDFKIHQREKMCFQRFIVLMIFCFLRHWIIESLWQNMMEIILLE